MQDLMIEARKSRLFDLVFRHYNDRILRNHFYRIHLSGRSHLDALDRTVPTILVANHSCWWDGLIEYHLSKRVFGFDSFIMMDEIQLRRYRFFRWIGAFSVDRHSPRRAWESVRYAESLLQGSNRVLWIYPQGVMKPSDARPLGFYSGAARIAQALGTVQLVPVAHRYEFVNEQRPEGFVRIGAAFAADPAVKVRQLTSLLEDRVTALLDSLKQSIATGRLEDFEVILHGRRSTNVVYDSVHVPLSAR